MSSRRFTRRLRLEIAIVETMANGTEVRQVDGYLLNGWSLVIPPDFLDGSRGETSGWVTARELRGGRRADTAATVRLLVSLSGVSCWVDATATWITARTDQSMRPEAVQRESVLCESLDSELEDAWAPGRSRCERREIRSQRRE